MTALSVTTCSTTIIESSSLCVRHNQIKRMINDMCKKILIVDDEESFCELVSEILSREGFDVIQANNVVEAEELMDGNDFKVVLLDIVMPGESGMTFLKRLRSKGFSTPVIILTGHPQMNTAVDSFKYGAMDYLSKPITADKLTKTVKKTIAASVTRKSERTVIISDGARFISGYRVKRILGEGSMGMVYLVSGRNNDGVKRDYAVNGFNTFIA